MKGSRLYHEKNAREDIWKNKTKQKKQGRRERTSEVQGERCKEEYQETRTYKIPEKRKFREKQV